MCGMWPFAGHPSEVIIWQVGRGIKQPLMNCQASREVKVRFSLKWFIEVFNIYIFPLGPTEPLLGL